MYETQDGNEPRALAIVAPRVQLDQQKLLVLKATIAPGLTGPELAFFGHVCQRMQLDPFARQIYAIKRGDKLTIQVGIDGFRALAERTGLYRGQLGPLWCGADGVWLDAWLSDEAPVAAKVGVIRAGFAEPIWSVARTRAYRQDSNALWRTMPDVLIAKCAEALALRKTFPDALGGAYEHDEMDQAGHAAIVDEAEYAAARVAEVTPIAETAPESQPEPAPKPATARAKPASASANTTDQPVSAGAWDALKRRLSSELGLGTAEQQATFIRAMLKRDLGGELPTRADYTRLSEGITRAIEQKHNAESKLSRTASRPAAPPAPSADEMAAAQADYDASQSSATANEDDFPSESNDYDLHKLAVPGVRP